MSYLRFEQIPTANKTATVHVIAVRSGAPLGTIKWFGRWRQYAFYPEPDTVFNTDCMTEISGHIMGLMAERKNARASVS